MEYKVCSIFGHRFINITNELKNKVKITFKDLIVNHNVDTFLFGSRSKFYDLCLDVLTEYKKEYPFIKRVYVRAEFPYISEEYRKYLLRSYDDTYYPEQILNSGNKCYVERNQHMIDKSDYCVFYYNDKYKPQSNKKPNRYLPTKQSNSGTALAYKYAKQKKKNIISIINNKINL